jgi:serine/threonine protein kinase
MDKIKANSLLGQLKDRRIAGISIKRLINNGKSAAVFYGEKDDKPYAIKIFDSELITSHGVEIQKKRTELELSLRNHEINNLVKIYNGGNENIENIEYFYLIMEYIEGVNLKEYIERNKITIEFIIKTINTLIATTEALLSHDPSLAHRDIKPENIMISSSDDVILMDLGVLLIVGSPSMSDVDQKQFLGTLRYAPPEFLTRQEENSIDGWRSINIYQIGAVLHDMIMHKELFADKEPYANLVIAIKEDMPSIINADFRPDLIQLARNMLQKNWRKRLDLCPLDTIQKILENSLLPYDKPTDILSEIKSGSLHIREELETIDQIKRGLAEKRKIRNEISIKIDNLIRNSFDELRENEIIKTINESRNFQIGELTGSNLQIENKFYIIEGKFEYGFSRSVIILFRIENNENSYCRILVKGVIPGLFIKVDPIHPDELIQEIFIPKTQLKQRITNPPKETISFKCIFDGIFESDDNSFKELIDTTIAKILRQSINKMRPEIENELEDRKQRLGINSGVHMRISVAPRTILINDF